MQFRRSGQRDERRRRVLTERLLDSGRSSSRRTTSRSTSIRMHRVERKSENYGDAEFMEDQPRLMDLIPRRLTTFLLLMVAGLLVVAGLELLYGWSLSLADSTTDGRIAALDLDGEGSLTVWFSSTALLLAAMTAVVVFTVRRYKTDDYQGYYRIWLWAAMCWLLMSVDETASLHEGFKEMMTRVTGTPILGDGSAWWIIPYFFLLAAVGTRLLVDMRHCRLSSGAFVAVAVCYAVAVVGQLGWILPTEDPRAVMLEEGAEMVGTLFLLLAMGLHARYVILDAEGLLPQRAAHAEEEEMEEEEDELDEEELEAENAILFGHSVKVHPPDRVSEPASRRNRTDAFTASMKSAESSVGRKLTRQEKKALRRRLEKLRRQRKTG